MTAFTPVRTKHIHRAKYYSTFIAGMLLNAWMLPAEALNVPTQSGMEQTTRLAYYPMNRFMFVLLLFVPAIYIGYYFVQNKDFASSYTVEDN